MSCLSSETLLRFLSGSSPDRAAIEAHVAVCSHCRCVLDELSDNPDLRRWVPIALALPTESAADPVLVQVMTELQSASGELSAHGPSPHSESHWPRGQVLGQYRVEEEFGRGGMGLVLRAFDETLGRIVALKVLRSQETDAKARARLVHEAQAVAKLRDDTKKGDKSNYSLIGLIPFFDVAVGTVPEIPKKGDKSNYSLIGLIPFFGVKRQYLPRLSDL